MDMFIAKPKTKKMAEKVKTCYLLEYWYMYTWVLRGKVG